MLLEQQFLLQHIVGLKEIANEIDSPIAFTAKILQVLVKNNIIKSSKGVGGGFMILKDDLKNIKLSDIVIAIDGDSVFLRCGLGLSKCSATHPCPIHDDYKAVRDLFEKMCRQKNVKDLCDPVNSGVAYLLG